MHVGLAQPLGFALSSPSRCSAHRGPMYDRRPGFFRTEDAPTGRRVEAKVKWFNAAKGFGFVTLSDGSPDAFLPMAVLRRAGHEDVRGRGALSRGGGPRAQSPPGPA